MVGDPVVSALGRAMEAVDLAYTDPVLACRLASQVIAVATDVDPEPRSVAERAFGMALTSIGRLPEAELHFRAAIDVAERNALPRRAAEARGSIAYLLTLTGRSAEALHAVDRAVPVLDGVPAARVQMLRALVLSELGRYTEAVVGFGAALDLLDRYGGDPLLEADIRTNRSIAHVHHRDWHAAEEDLARAERLYDATGHPGRTAMVFHNRGLAATVRGDLPAALTAFDEAASRYRASGREPGSLAVERAEALLAALLVDDARHAATSAIASLRRERNAVDLLQARLLLARAALLAGDHAVATDQAGRARRAAIRQRRPGSAALAGYLTLRARWECGPHDDALIRAGRRSVVALTGAGRVVEALDARLIVARTAMELGRPVVARRELAGAAGVRRDSPADLRAKVWHARALLRLSEGDRRGAEAALMAGVRLLDEFRASLGATELRVHAAGHAGDIARTGLRLAMAAGDVGSALRWTERWRAGSLLLYPARPAADQDLALLLAELRQVVAQLGTVAGGDGVVAQLGTVAGGDGGIGRLRKRQAELEQVIRDRSHRTGGGRSGGGRGSGWGSGPPSVASLREALGPAVMVEYLTLDGDLHAVVVGATEPYLVSLGPVAAVEPELTALRYGLRKLAYGVGTSSAATALVAHKARRLESVLLGPLATGLGDRPLVIVPTGVLHAVPWAALPGCTGRTVSVAPSAGLWHRARSAAAPATGRPVFAAGPGLAHATAEVITLARRYDGARRFTGGHGRVETVLEALDGAALAHIAAHGHFRSDNPLFSSLQLVDGPLTVYDLESLKAPPRHVILSACESGLSTVHPGDELQGLAAALLAMGSSSLIAAVVPVPDEASRPLMLRLHRYLRAGHDPAEALARAQRTLAGTAAGAAATGFLCFGAG